MRIIPTIQRKHPKAIQHLSLPHQTRARLSCILGSYFLLLLCESNTLASRSVHFPTISKLNFVTLYVGKYHSSKYKLISPVAAPSPTDKYSPSPTRLEISSARKRPAFERRTSDLERSLQHLRDRITQARLASSPGISEPHYYPCG